MLYPYHRLVFLPRAAYKEQEQPPCLRWRIHPSALLGDSERSRTGGLPNKWVHQAATTSSSLNLYEKQGQVLINHLPGH